MMNVDRFWSYVTYEPNSGCWLWTGAANNHGYGQFLVGSMKDGTRRMAYVHRLSFELHNKVKLGRCNIIMHACDNPTCLNPKHLSMGTQKQNVRDAIKKGRMENRGDKDFCLHGHPWNDENIYVNKKTGAKFCRKCSVENGRKSRRRRRKK